MSALRKKTVAPAPVAKRPIASTATVTPVTFARRLRPRHPRVTASVFFARAAPLDQGPRQAVLPALSMYPKPRLVWMSGSEECGSILRRR